MDKIAQQPSASGPTVLKLFELVYQNLNLVSARQGQQFEYLKNLNKNRLGGRNLK
jgi:hypothetical protein